MAFPHSQKTCLLPTGEVPHLYLAVSMAQCPNPWRDQNPPKDHATWLTPPDHYRGHYTFAGTPRGPMPSTTPTPAPTHHLGPLQHPCHPHVASVIATHTRHSNEGPSLPPQPQPIVPNLRAGLAMRPWPTLPANPNSLSLAVGVGNPIQSLSTYNVV